MSLSQTLLKYPEDLSGLSSFNLVQDERKTIPRTTSRHFAPAYGPFFAGSVSIRTVPGNVPLVLNQDYVVLLPDQQASLKAGQSVCFIIAIINPAHYGELAYNYQTIGGNYTASTSAIESLIRNLEIDNRSIQFDDLIDLPITFPPSPHMHVVGDLFGWDDMVNIGNQILNQIQIGQQADFDVINARFAALESEVDALTIHVNTTMQSQIGENANQITVVKSQIVTINQTLTTINNTLTKNTSSKAYQTLPTGGTLKAGGRYRLTAATVYTLQDTGELNFDDETLVVGQSIDFICDDNVAAIIKVFAELTQRIKVKANYDTSVRCLTAKSGRIVYIGPGTWEIFL